jgi:hypothetical protein
VLTDASTISINHEGWKLFLRNGRTDVKTKDDFHVMLSEQITYIRALYTYNGCSLKNKRKTLLQKSPSLVYAA